MEEFLGEHNALGMDYNEHGEAEEFKQKMEDASNIPDNANVNITNIKSSIIGISVALVAIVGLFFIGICFAGRIVIKSCKGKWSRASQNDATDSTSFTFENDHV